MEIQILIYLFFKKEHHEVWIGFLPPNSQALDLPRELNSAFLILKTLAMEEASNAEMGKTCRKE